MEIVKDDAVGQSTAEGVDIAYMDDEQDIEIRRLRKADDQK